MSLRRTHGYGRELVANAGEDVVHAQRTPDDGISRPWLEPAAGIEEPTQATVDETDDAAEVEAPDELAGEPIDACRELRSERELTGAGIYVRVMEARLARSGPKQVVDAELDHRHSLNALHRCFADLPAGTHAAVQTVVSFAPEFAVEEAEALDADRAGALTAGSSA